MRARAALLAGIIATCAVPTHAADLMGPSNAALTLAASRELRILLGLSDLANGLLWHQPLLISLRPGDGSRPTTSTADNTFAAIVSAAPRFGVIRDWRPALLACQRAMPLWAELFGDARADLIEVTAWVQLAAHQADSAGSTTQRLVLEVRRFPSLDPERRVRAQRVRDYYLAYKAETDAVRERSRQSVTTRTSWLGATAEIVGDDDDQRLPSDPIRHLVAFGELADDLALRYRQVARGTQVDANGLTVLARSCMDNQYLAQQLLEAGAQCRTVDRLGRTPLHWAARSGYAPLLRELLAAGSDPTVKDTCGTTALDLARKCGHVAATEVLQAAVSTRSRSPHSRPHTNPDAR